MIVNIIHFSTFFVYTEDTSDILNTALTGIVDPIVYGVFNTPVNAISGSAVCMFNISDVIETFMGSFKDQEAMDSNWLPVKKVWLAVYIIIAAYTYFMIVIIVAVRWLYSVL